MDLKDRKAIKNGLPGFKLGDEGGGNLMSLVDSYTREYASKSYTPTIGNSSIVAAAQGITDLLNKSTQKPVTQHLALQNVNNTTTSSWRISSTASPLTFLHTNYLPSEGVNTFLMGYKPQESWDIDKGSLFLDGITSIGTNKFQAKPLSFGDGLSKLNSPIEPNLTMKVAPLGKIDGLGYLNLKPGEAVIKNAPKAPVGDTAAWAVKGQGLAKAGKVAGKAMGVAQGVMGGIQLVNQWSEGSKARINPEEMLMKYGTSNTNIGGGFSYERQNNINTESEMELVKAETNQNTMGMAMTGMGAGAAIGSVLGPVGGAVGAVAGGLIGAVGGLFSSSARRRAEEERLRRARILANNKTSENRQNAFTEKIRKEIANKYGNQEDQLLYASKGAEYVMPNGLTNKNHNTLTAFGNINAPANALTQAGEKIVHVEEAKNPYEDDKYYIHKVTGSKSDSNYTYLFPNDSVIKKENAPYVELAIREGRYNEFLQKQALDREMKHGKISTNKNNNLVRARKGLEWYTNAIPAITGFGIGMQQYNKAANLDIYKPNSFQQNQYIGALNDLDKLHIDYLPIANELRAAEARVNRAIDYSGGLLTGQRATNRIASNLNTLNAIANGLMNWQKWNNELRSAAAKSRLEVGAQEAQRKLQAEQWDADTYAKGHAAREQQMNMGWYNMQNALEQYTANEFKRNQFNRTMNLYEQENQLKWQEIWNNMNKGDNSTIKIENPFKEKSSQGRIASVKMPQLKMPGTTPTPTYTAPSMNLRYGMKNSENVRNLQNILNLVYKNDMADDGLKYWDRAQGKKIQKLVPDGNFGPLTKAAVKRFQMDQFNGINRYHTGFYGNLTRGKLAELLKSTGGI